MKIKRISIGAGKSKGCRVDNESEQKRCEAYDGPMDTKHCELSEKGRCVYRKETAKKPVKETEADTEKVQVDKLSTDKVQVDKLITEADKVPAKIKIKKAVKEPSPVPIVESDCNKEDMSLFEHPEEPARLAMSAYTLPDKTSFPASIGELAIKSQKTPGDIIRNWNPDNNSYMEISPQSHQKFVADYLNENSPYRGLLLYHGLGSGKSGASIMIAEGFPHRRCIIMLPASLAGNYYGEIKTFGAMAYKHNFYWCFRSLYEHRDNLLNTELLDEFGKLGIPADLFEQIAIKQPSKRQIGIWMIDPTKPAPNFNELSSEEQTEIEAQIMKMIDYKYTFVNYNGGNTVILKLLETFNMNLNEVRKKLIPERKGRIMKSDDRDMLINAVYKGQLKNPFDNKLLIIDEVHNLTSMMSGESSYNGLRLYELIMRAENLKVVLLSGTPVINDPFEMAISFNMIKGGIMVYRMPLTRTRGQAINRDALEQIISLIPSINEYRVTSDYIEITRVPNGFTHIIKDGKRIGQVHRSAGNTGNNNDWIDFIARELNKQGYELHGITTMRLLSIFPHYLRKERPNNIPGSLLLKQSEMEQERQVFENIYVDKENTRVNPKAEIRFKNRILGLVSFFNEVTGKDEKTGAELFPRKEVASEAEVTVPMSDYQFLDVYQSRQIERELEKASVRRAQQNPGSKMSSLFRVFSRQRGIFVFPPGIRRPLPPKRNTEALKEIKKKVGELANKAPSQQLGEQARMLEDMGEEERALFQAVAEGEEPDLELIEENPCTDMDTDECPIDQTAEEQYEREMKKAISEISAHKEYLTINQSPYNLAVLSPKYAKMLENINKTPGLVFCYSQYRSVEGIELFSRVLEANGYTALRSTNEGRTFDKTALSVGLKVRVTIGNDDWVTGEILEMGKKVSVRLNDGKIRDYKPEEVYPARFALWTGTESAELRTALLRYFNQDTNMYGQQCLVLMATASGAEGISLFNTRQVHIMEPYWNLVRTNQVIGRARRVRSHVRLPEKHRSVRVYEYIIHYTSEQLKGTWGRQLDPLEALEHDSNIRRKELTDDEKKRREGFRKMSAKELERAFISLRSEMSATTTKEDESMTSDQELRRIALQKSKLLESFLQLVRSSAVDCSLNRKNNLASGIKVECYNQITGESQTEGVVYDLLDLEEVKTKGLKAEAMRVKEELRAIRYPFRLPDGRGQLSLLLLLESNKEPRDMKDGDIIYDYYVYNQLYEPDPRPMDTRYQIATVMRRDNKVVFRLSEEFKSRIDDYLVLEECMEEFGRDMPLDDIERGKWSQRIYECYRARRAIKADDKLKGVPNNEIWKCAMCRMDISKDIMKCPKGCNFTQAQWAIYEEFISRQSAQKAQPIAVAPETPVPSFAPQPPAKAEEESRPLKVIRRRF